ncbi:DUF4862 family protein [Nakamurella lactea]|uniref:DUF4862 family protein n=1 Tax=Nakamurella lactea TaxID=459515 RepID=UPI0004283620|nr:DUF4862 family protein [Nakamurella lactea]
MSFLVGAYAAAPSDPSAPEFAEFFRALAAEDLVGGLELPTSHLTDAAAVRAITEAASPDWTYALTCFPGTMFALAKDPSVGLASPSEASRGQAVEFVAELREQAARFDEAAGGGRLERVFLHSAPVGGVPDALATSLAEIVSWDWAGARLEIEHCDAAVPGQEPQKGFLSLADELAVLADVGSTGVVINWGRSAIETRSAEGPVLHLQQAREAGLLSGLMFSGVSAVDTDYGAGWLDAHLASSTRTPGSMMTPSEISRCVAAAGDAFLGAKIGVKPADAPVQERVAAIIGLLQEIRDAQG